MSTQWDESLTTGVPSIDDQHRRLVHILGQVLEAMEQGRSRADVGEVLDELDRYTAGHFSHEEECMFRYDCPAGQRNEREHREFLRIVVKFRRDFDANGATTRLVLRVREQLAWWLETHIRTVDTQLYPCVRTRADPAGSSQRRAT